MDQNKKWCISVMTTTLSILLLCAVVVLAIDPFVQYNTSLFKLRPVFSRSTQAYLNPGIAKNYQYDSVIIGSSVSENFYASQFDATFNCTTIKLPFAGASSLNYSMILDVAFRTHNLKYVFYSVDMFGLIYDAGKPRNNPVPSYLYNSNPFDDISYLLNKDSFIYVFQMLVANKNHTVVDLDEAYNWERSSGMEFSEKRVLSQYVRPEQTITKAASDAYYDQINASIENIAPYIEAHPQTQFILFYPPYSVIQHDYYIRTGTFDALCYGMEYSMEKWLEYDNVQVYSFINCKDIISDLNNYREMMHFSEKINTYMVDKIGEGKYQITSENVQQEMDAFRAYLQGFDFSVFFNETATIPD